MSPAPPGARRPLATRGAAWAIWASRRLAAAGASPDAISAAGLGFAALAALAFAAAPGWAPAWLLGAGLVQLRLAANLLDGMVAVEGGRGGPLGPLWNEAPDRIADTLILAGFGVAAGDYALGLWAALAALFCAYVRSLAGALGQEQSFAGPMAKPHRMAAVTLAALAGFGASLAGAGPTLPWLGLWAILLGTLATAARRIAILAAGLRAGRR